jgi:hypothetical protein
MLVLASIQLTVLLLLHQQPVEAGQLSQGITDLAMDMAANIGKLGCGYSLEFRKDSSLDKNGGERENRETQKEKYKLCRSVFVRGKRCII